MGRSRKALASGKHNLRAERISTIASLTAGIGTPATGDMSEARGNLGTKDIDVTDELLAVSDGNQIPFLRRTKYLSRP